MSEVLVFTAEMARELLKAGYMIVDIKPDKYDADKKRSIFVFKNDAGLEDRIKAIADRKKAR